MSEEEKTYSLIKGNKSLSEITKDLLRPVSGKPGWLWYAGMIVSLALLTIGTIATITTIHEGIGTWGVNNTVGWGWGITNFVWWIGIGHAGTFISAILLLFRKKWRTSINRSAEAMTIIAILCGTFFPIIHMGRAVFAYYIFPYPNANNLTVNFNSPLLWDVFAIGTYFIVSFLFLYVGLLPDIATIRDKTKSKLGKHLYSVMSLGWIGSARHWFRLEKINMALAGLAAALVVSVHSIVSMDFATSIIPGWHSTIFPPYFVAGALLSGFAMVLTLSIIARKALNIQEYIKVYHIEQMNKIILVTSMLVVIAYGTELFMAWYSGNEYEHFVFINRLSRKYMAAYLLMLSCNFLLPQLLWFKKLRQSIKVTFILSILINLGMWMERFVIVVSSLAQDYLPANWTDYAPTKTEVGLFLGTIGFFFTMYLLFIRVFPIISLWEIKSLKKEEKE